MKHNKLHIYHFDDDSKILESTKDTIEQPLKDQFKEVDLLWTSYTDLNDLDKIDLNSSNILILDLSFTEENHNQKGEVAYKELKDKIFIPIIFYTGHTNRLTEIGSENSFVVNKGDGIRKLIKIIEDLIKSNVPFLKHNLHNLVEEKFKTFFWNIIDSKSDIINNVGDSIQLGYSIYRNIGASLTSDNIRHFLDTNGGHIAEEKVHPLQMYIYPITREENFEIGDLVVFNNKHYIVLTPSCDFVKRKGKPLKVKKVFLLECKDISELEEYKNYLEAKEKGDASLASKKNILMSLLRATPGSQYFYLPKTYFLEKDLVVDYQNKVSVEYDLFIKNYSKIAKLDSPFIESLLNKYLDYYGRIGTPDLDIEYSLANI